MKLIIARQSEQQPAFQAEQANEVLRLAAEMLENTGEWPKVDVIGARMDHWNGRKIAIDRVELNQLMSFGLIDEIGEWTDHGHRELSRQAGIETPDAPTLKLVRG